jgi:hypothetical protein
MAADLAVPFRLAAGRAVLVNQDTVDYRVQLVTDLVATRPNERPMVPRYGLEDPTFTGLDIGDLSAGLELWASTVRIGQVQSTRTGRTQTYRIEVQ